MATRGSVNVHNIGAVTISHSGVVAVCSGEELELICTITDSGSFTILMWNVTVNAKVNAATSSSLDVAISSSSPTNQTIHRMVNSTNVTCFRISPQNSSPLVSRLFMNPVSNHLNGTQVKCVNAMTSESSSVAVINVSNGNPIQGMEL